MQSEQATPFRGWRVPVLAFLKAVGNHMREATHAQHTRARTQAHTKPSSSSGPDTSCLRSGIPETENPSGGEPGGASPALSGPPLLLTPVIFPALAVTPHSPPSVPGSNSAHDRALSRFKFPPPPPRIDRPALSTLPSTLFAFPKAKTFPTRAENFFLPSQRDQARNRISRYRHPLRPAPGWRAPSLPGRCAPGDRPTAVARASPTRGGRPVRCPLVASCSALRERVS